MKVLILVLLAAVAVLCLLIAICIGQVAGRAKGFEEGYFFEEKIKQEELQREREQANKRRNRNHADTN